MIKFGTGGWRAEIGQEFTMENIQKIAQGLCTYIKQNKQEDFVCRRMQMVYLMLFPIRNF